ncbi:MAG: SPOR domain-containing protein [Flavobacteriales bacterium]|nr:SPOR domain-containing protein [Flavobacteriales bacterium]
MIYKFNCSIFLVALWVAPFYIFAQAPDVANDASVLLDASDNYTIVGDKRINDLEKRYAEINKNSPQIKGYRIQLFSSSGASSWDQANQVQGEFLKIYPDIPSYVIHKKPSFKVRIGDYRTRLDAERFFIELKENFPDAFIVNDMIELPKLANEESK